MEPTEPTKSHRGWIIATLVLIGIVVAGLSFGGGYVFSQWRQSLASDQTQAQAAAPTAAQSLGLSSASQPTTTPTQTTPTTNPTPAPKPATTTTPKKTTTSSTPTTTTQAHYQAQCKDGTTQTYTSKTASACSNNGGLVGWL